MLAIEAISKSFGGVKAVNAVGFSVAAGSIHGLIGPNGAGKTTMINLISGFLTPDSGRIVLDGREIQRLSPDAHLLDAEVKEFIYMGDIFRTRLSVAGNDDFIITRRNAPDQERLKPGQKIKIGWLAEDCRALDA